MIPTMLLLQAAASLGAPSDMSSQASPPVSAAPASCRLVKHALAPSNVSDLAVICGKKVMLLGAAESAASAFDPVRGSMIVVARMNGRQRVYLTSPTAAGNYTVDEISGDLAKASGRSVDAGVPVDTAVDISGFAATGLVKVPAVKKASASQGKAMIAASKVAASSTDAASAPPDAVLDLKAYAARAASFRAEPSHGGGTTPPSSK